MKKNDWFIIITTVAYSYLFYNQSAGVNFFIFNILIALLLLFSNKTLLQKTPWLVACAGSLISSFFVFWWGTDPSICTNVCSLLVLAGFSFNPASSLLVAALNSCYSIIAAIPQALVQSVHISQQQFGTPGENQGIFKKLLLFVLPAIITCLFYYIYKFSNPAFAKLADKIDLDFISFEWLTFTASGFLIMFGVFRFVAFKWLTDSDSKSSDSLSPVSLEEHLKTTLGRGLSASNEILMGVMLFALLNLLLLCVNGVDIYCMWIAKQLPAGITVADYLHDGTDTLIVSIIMAIAVILFVFRGYLNFSEQNKWLKLLCYGWIAQNAMLVISTANRNWWIIQSSGLTRKRIGVYIYLLLCLVGLTTTLIKVARTKSNWFLFRKNGWIFYGVFIAACFFNWDDIIVRYNCKNFKSLQFDYIDRNYQVELSHTCLASLFEYYAREHQESNPVHKIFVPNLVVSMYHKYYDLKKEQEASEWKSFCMSKKKNLDAVEEMIKEKKVEEKPN